MAVVNGDREFSNLNKEVRGKILFVLPDDERHQIKQKYL